MLLRVPPLLLVRWGRSFLGKRRPMPALRRWSMPHWVRWEHSGLRFHWGNALRRWCDSNTLPYFAGMYREAFGGMCHLFVADGSGSDGFQRINPTVAHTVGELFFCRQATLWGVCRQRLRGLLSFLSPCRGTS